MSQRVIHEIDPETGIVLLEMHRLNGRLHRNSKQGPALIHRHPDTGTVIEERYYWNGRLHREDGAAVLEYNYLNSVPMSEMYYRHGLIHRDPKQGPARLERNDSGTILLVAGALVAFSLSLMG